MPQLATSGGTARDRLAQDGAQLDYDRPGRMVLQRQHHEQRRPLRARSAALAACAAARQCPREECGVLDGDAASDLELDAAKEASGTVRNGPSPVPTEHHLRRHVLRKGMVATLPARPAPALGAAVVSRRCNRQGEETACAHLVPMPDEHARRRSWQRQASEARTGGPVVDALEPQPRPVRLLLPALGGQLLDRHLPLPRQRVEARTGDVDVWDVREVVREVRVVALGQMELSRGQQSRERGRRQSWLRAAQPSRARPVAAGAPAARELDAALSRAAAGRVDARSKRK
mmetsp:Transcript_5698/g.19189  ORF Transcript_5698/g.19189 Transcript_5698/m.19189 type:complete len:288 (+) Transcript_5698:1991-2854(+)